MERTKKTKENEIYSNKRKFEGEKTKKQQLKVTEKWKAKLNERNKTNKNRKIILNGHTILD